jgi:hypothetical protein
MSLPTKVGAGNTVTTVTGIDASDGGDGTGKLLQMAATTGIISVWIINGMAISSVTGYGLGAGCMVG